MTGASQVNQSRSRGVPYSTQGRTPILVNRSNAPKANPRQTQGKGHGEPPIYRSPEAAFRGLAQAKHQSQECDVENNIAENVVGLCCRLSDYVVRERDTEEVDHESQKKQEGSQRAGEPQPCSFDIKVVSMRHDGKNCESDEVVKDVSVAVGPRVDVLPEHILGKHQVEEILHQQNAEGRGQDVSEELSATRKSTLATELE